MLDFFLFMAFWMTGILVLLGGLYAWYLHHQRKTNPPADPPPKPKLIQYQKLDR